MSFSFGKELILDLHGCELAVSRETLKRFFEELCELIDMERENLHFWDYDGFPEEYAAAPPHLKGISAVQFIRTSSITVHVLEDLKAVYNEMPSNALYVEGSILDRFLEGKVNLVEVRSNSILVATNKIEPIIVNATNAARATMGCDVKGIVELETPLQMVATFEDGAASGEVSGWRELVSQVGEYDFDALAIATPIECPAEVALNYFDNGGVNPWGGVEAKASRLIADALDKPVAHAPVETDQLGDYHKRNIVDPRVAAEMVSTAFVHCVFKGLNKAPRPIYHLGKGTLSVDDVDCMVSPHGCWGRPHEACAKANIPILEVIENKTIFDRNNEGTIKVENYLEAVGCVTSLKSGVFFETVRRPLLKSKITQ